MIEVQTSNPFTAARIVGENVSGADYRKNPGKRGDVNYVMSRSDLMEFAWCPSRWRAGYSDPGGKATEWGTLMDGLLLDAEHFDERFAVTPKFYPADGKKGEEPTMKLWTFQANYCKQWREDQGDKEIVKWDDFEEAQKALAVLREDSDVIALLAGARRQVMVAGEYRDKKTGLVIPVKALLDIVPDIAGEFGRLCVDLKTCTSAGPGPWVRAVWDQKYHVQGAFHLDMYCAATGEDRNTFAHLLQENYAPWQLGKRFLSEDFIQIGRMKYTEALERYARCLKENVWPGYERYDGEIMPGWAVVSPEMWMINQM